MHYLFGVPSAAQPLNNGKSNDNERRLRDAERRDAEIKRSLYIARRELENIMRLVDMDDEPSGTEQHGR